MKPIYSLIFSIPFFVSPSLAQTKMKPEDYISKYYTLAVEEMNRYKIPASIKLAQGLIETESGNSLLATKANNHFGIKCKSEWTGGTFIKDDDTKNECFRAYNSAEESYRDHSIFLLKPRYSELFNLDISDYRGWAFGLKQAGYATNPNYPAMLIKYIEDYKLHQFDKFGKDKNPPRIITSNESSKNVTNKEELIKRRRTLANNLELTIVDDAFDIYATATSLHTNVANLLEINDLEGEQSMRRGQNFFLQKKLKGNAIEKHQVQAGESIYDISQMYGVNLKLLKKYNKLENWEQPHVGEILFLSKLRDDFIKTRPFYLVERERQLKNLELSIPIDTMQTVNYEAANVSNNSTLNTKVDSVKTSISSLPENTKSNQPNTDGRTWINHIVSNEETIFKICKRYGCKPGELIDWNGLKIEEGIKPGQVLRINTQYPNGLPLDSIPKAEPQIEAMSALSNTSLTAAMEEEAKQNLKIADSTINKKEKSLPNRDTSGSWFPHLVKTKETLFSISKLYNCRIEEILQWNEMKENQGIKIGQTLKIKSKATNSKSSINIIPKKIELDSSKTLPESKKPRVTILKNPTFQQTKDSLAKTPIAPASSAQKINMSELYKSIKKDSSVAPSNKNRIKLVEE